MNSLSLKAKLVSAVIAFGVVLSIGIALVFSNLMHTIQEDSKDSLKGMASTLSDAVAAQFFERYGDIQAFALNPDVKANDRETIVKALNNYVALYGIYDLIMVVSKDGKLVAVNDKNPAGESIKSDSLYDENYSKYPWFSETLAGKFVEDKEHAFAGSHVENVHADPFVSKVYGGTRYGNSFSAQVKDSQGNVIGVITNRAGSRWYEVALKEVKEFTKMQGLPSANIMLSGNDGRILAQVSEEKDAEKLESNGTELGLKPVELLKDQEHGATYYSYKKTPVIAGFDRITGAKMVRSLGWNSMVQAPVSEVFAGVNKAKTGLIAVISSLILLMIGLAYWASIKLSKTFANVAQGLFSEAQTLGKLADEMSSNSIKLSSAVSEQAAAIQETAASADEVSATAQKSSDNAKESLKFSSKSREAAEEGKKAVDDMVEAINGINASTTSVLSQVEEGNSQISEIVKVISEIGNKTKVINDIVFQTKLLSFNASVEAARAGEHGKGFAVVAEEVGNLAQMSGNAAKEISSMLDSSISRVEQIVQHTKTRVEHMMQESRQKTDQSKVVAERCSSSLDNILATVNEVDAMVSEIASASSEQAVGVTEINKAMSSLNQTTQSNAVISQETALQSDKLKNQAGNLSGIVDTFVAMIHGSKEGGNSFSGTHTGDHFGALKVDKPQNTETKKISPKHKAESTKGSSHSPRQSAKKMPENVIKFKEPESSQQEEVRQAGGAEGLPDVNDPRFKEM